MVHAKKRSEEVEEKAAGGLQGERPRVLYCKWIHSHTRAISPNIYSWKKISAGLTNKVKAVTTTFSSRGANPRGSAPRKQGTGTQGASPTKKQEGFKLGTLSLGGPGSRRNDPNTVSTA